MSCTGYCCSFFSLPFDLATLKMRAHELADGEQIAEMVIPLTTEQVIQQIKESGMHSDVEPSDDYFYFTCKNWDKKTRLCSIYESRPKMCRLYGQNGETCKHGCGLCEKGDDLNETR